MSRSKVTILSKYVMALAILALLFSVAITTSRYALQQSSSSTIGIESFDVDVKLLNSDKQEISGDISLDATTEDLSNYTEVYYLDITNNDSDTLYYKIEEQTGNFCFAVGAETTRYTTYAGSLDTTSTELTLTVSLHPDVNVVSNSGQSLEIKLYAEYQHTEEYTSVEVTEPEPEPEPEPGPEDENHTSTDGWTALTSSNIGSASNNAGKYYLSDDITVSSTLTLASDTTLCLNGHTLTGSSSLNPLISVTTGNVIVEDCQGSGEITGASTAINVAGNATLTLEGKPIISSNTTNVYLANGAYITLGELEEGANIGVTSATSISGSNSVQITSTETSTYNYESAIKYIHADNSSYKVSMNHGSDGYLTLMSKDYVNVSVAIHYTSGTYSNSIYLNGDSAAYMETNLTLTSSYSGTYAYNTYVQYGAWEVSSTTHNDFRFVIGTNTGNLWYYGFAKDNNLSINWSTSNYYLWGTQYYYNASGDDDSSIWGCNFSEGTLYQTMQSIGDWTIVLELNPSSINSQSTNNIVSNVYFVVDGVQQNLVS